MHVNNKAFSLRVACWWHGSLCLNRDVRRRQERTTFVDCKCNTVGDGCCHSVSPDIRCLVNKGDILHRSYVKTYLFGSLRNLWCTTQKLFDQIFSVLQERDDQIKLTRCWESHIFYCSFQKNTLAFWKNLHFKSSAAVGLQWRQIQHNQCVFI